MRLDSVSNFAKAFKHFSFYEAEHSLTDLVEGQSKNVFVREYVKVMRPVACDLDILQGATVVGYLLPMLAIIVNQLNALLEDITNPLPPINGLRAGKRRRFDDTNNNTDSRLAALVLPQFKLYWLSGEVQKARLCATLSHIYMP